MALESTSMFNHVTISNGTDSDSDLYAEYDYDFEDSHVLPLKELVPVSIAYGLTLVLGITGNILVIASVIRFRKLHSVTNVFLLSLASADLLLVVICVPVKVSQILKTVFKLSAELILYKGRVFNNILKDATSEMISFFDDEEALFI